jgi:hypothetical protein
MAEYRVNGMPTLRTIFAETDWRETIRIYQSPKTFRDGGQDTPEVPLDRLEYQEITLPEPRKKVLGGGITQDALHDGLSSAEVMMEWESSRDAHIRLENQWTMRALLQDGGFWDATAAPPRYANNTMASSHDHYLAYNVAGVLALTHCNRIYRHMDEHGYGGDVVLMMNGGTIELTSNLADWASDVNSMTPAMEVLQTAGFKALKRVGNMTLVQNDYVPLYYGVAVDLAAPRKPLVWREAKLPGVDGGLQTFREGPNIQYYEKREYLCWVSSAVQLRGAGVCIYLNNAAWSNPSVTEWN